MVARRPKLHSARLWALAGAVAAGMLALGAYHVLGQRRAGETATFSQPGTRPNVIFILLDTLRADRLGVYGGPPGLTPFLDRFAGESIVYERAHSPSSWTPPSIASLFLAEVPSEHQVISTETVLSQDKLCLAEVLRENGFHTGGFSANIGIRTEMGFGQGFEVFPPLHENLKGDAAHLNQAALRWLDGIAGDRRPFFLYLQYMEPHNPYRTHPGITAPRQAGLPAADAQLNARLAEGAFTAGLGSHDSWHFTTPEVERLHELYDGEVKYLDARLADLFAELERRSLLRHSIVIITADHGEEFGEHGVFDHGLSLFEQAIHVPLLIRLPDGGAARKVPEPVQLAGLDPTVFAYLGIKVPPSFRVPPLPLDSAEPGPRYAYSELVKPQALGYMLHRQAVVGTAHKLLVTDAGANVYYDLAHDPLEQQPLTAPAFAGDLLQAMSRLTAQSGTPAKRQLGAIDEATRERLRSLGYTQ
jgi:arylsulfatase A-like enzyme